MSTISDLSRACLKQFTDLIQSDALAQTPSQSGVTLRAWKDELGRLRLWIANIGAHQTGQSSLDYRLRDASHIRTQTLKVLKAISTLLGEMQSILSGEEEDEQDDLLDEELQDLVAELDLGDPSDVGSTIKEAHESLVNRMSQLFDISMSVRKPAQHDRLIGTERGDSEPFEFYFHQHVSHKYPAAEQALIGRISSAMAKQKATLKYRERHHLKLAQGLHGGDGDNSTVKLSETVASSFHRETHDMASDDLVSNSGVSCTSYAGSLLAGREQLVIPPLPKEAADQRPFECPFCYYIISVRDLHTWARHIFKDLMPYICIFRYCSTGNKLYDSRKNWYHHIRQVHMSSEGTTRSYECPLCKESTLPSNTFEKHVGRHLEELSLFVLPRTAPAEEEEEEDENRKLQYGQLKTESDSGLSNENASQQHFEPTSFASDNTHLVPVEDDGGELHRSTGLDPSAASPPRPSVRHLLDPEQVQKHPAPFQCHRCIKHFSRADNLRSHLQAHPDEKLFVCTICGRAFESLLGCKHHEDLHSGEKGFISQGDLSRGAQLGSDTEVAQSAKESIDRSTFIHSSLQTSIKTCSEDVSDIEQVRREIRELSSQPRISRRPATPTPPRPRPPPNDRFDKQTPQKIEYQPEVHPSRQQEDNERHIPVTTPHDDLFNRAINGYRDDSVEQHSYFPEGERNQIWNQRLSQFSPAKTAVAPAEGVSEPWLNNHKRGFKYMRK
ncbi:hypothetical protein BJX99DRAFT_258944 [Aspergillus californicus]